MVGMIGMVYDSWLHCDVMRHALRHSLKFCKEVLCCLQAIIEVANDPPQG